MGAIVQYHLPEIGPWGEEKYRLVRNYAQIFATSMKKKWQCRVYIDLFAGAGRARIKESRKIVDGSPLISLGIEDRFDRYIFCENDSTNLDALTKRVINDFSGIYFSFRHFLLTILAGNPKRKDGGHTVRLGFKGVGIKGGGVVFNVEMMKQFEVVVHAGAAETDRAPFFQVAVDFNGLVFEN